MILTLCVLSACSEQDGSPGAAAQTKPEVVIGRLICGGHLSLAVLEKHLQDNLSTVRLRTIQNHDWNDVIRDLKSGKLAGTFILSPLAMKLIRDGLPARIVLKADRNGNGFVLSEKVPSIDALRERTSIIAVPHLYSQHNVLLHRVLRQHRVPLDRVTVIAMPPRDMVSSLRRGEIDGFMVGEPEGNRAATVGAGWLAVISPQIWQDHMDHVFLVTDAFIRQHPGRLQELVTGLVHGGRYIESHPHQAAIMGQDYTGAGAAVFEKVLTSPPDWIDYSDMFPTPDDLRAMGAEMVKAGLWKDLPADLAAYADTRFVRQAYQVKQTKWRGGRHLASR